MTIHKQENPVFLTDTFYSINSSLAQALVVFNRYVRENWPDLNADLAWKYDHTMRVISISSKLLKQVAPVFCGTGGEEIFLGAALFHDIGRFIQFSLDDQKKKAMHTGGGHGPVGASVLEERIIPENPDLFTREQWEMIKALVKRHDTNFLSLETRRKAWNETKDNDRRGECDRNAFLLFGSLLRDADMVDNCANLYTEKWWERIRLGGFSGFDTTRREASDKLAENHRVNFGDESFSGSMKKIATVFNSYGSETLGDALLCLLATPSRLSFEVSKTMVRESPLLERVRKDIAQDDRTVRLYRFLKESLYRES